MKIISDIIKYIDTCIMASSQKEKRTNIFKEIMTENYTFDENMNLRLQEQQASIKD